ncbi:Uncharacterized damage-inducible protein DinB (forms a four-helix bundle) [Singulisphaera sp. GP187]|uniref:DinB family protein n=1 Tax=Singulisphaera sp. GP187 TaxID=1882752 RepID=UPI00092CA756|nr:DinB family protein [Singulisphaera sp. GP187]SIN78077.1 Uncharacterized damage-inducible protein DinB (forms a four-helix bundle) [Singulisphaera sp. GP187]
MSVTTELVRRLFGYMQWADEAMLAASSTVPDREYHLRRGFSHGSIHGLLVHGMAAQEVWLQRWRGDGQAAIEGEARYPTRSDLVGHWPKVHSSLSTFLESQTDESLQTTVTAQNTYGEWFSLPLGDTMIHVVDHATYHRGQINSMIKIAGGTPTAPYFQRYLARS